MRLVMLKIVVVTFVCATLSACVPGAPVAGTPAAKPIQTTVPEGVYGARADDQFNVAAVPVDQVPAEFQRQAVAYKTDQPVGTIIIDPSARLLYLVTAKDKATRFGIAVGRAGFQWSGEAVINERKNWPTWTPPPEMIERKPELAKFAKGQPGGLDNPLGARALYLTSNGVDYGYRIHGTPEWNSIGKNASSGCIRMINQDVMDLANMVGEGTKVVVLNADGSYPKGLNLPPKPPVKKKAVVAAAPAPAPIIVPMPSVMPTPVVTGPVTAAAPVVAAPAVVAPAVVAPAVVAPAVVAPAVVAPAVVAPAPVVCAVALVNGLCPAP